MFPIQFVELTYSSSQNSRDTKRKLHFTVLTPSPGSINPLRYFPCVILLSVVVIVLAGRGVGEVVDRCDSLKV